MLGFLGLIFGIFNNFGLAIVSAVVAILGLFGWYVIKNLDSSLKEEDKNQNAGS